MSSRDTRIDALRGLLLVVMAVNHLPACTTLFGQATGFVTAAEGFVFLSGFVSGLVHASPGPGEPSAIRRKIFRRWREIALAHVATLGLLAGLSLASAGYREAWAAYSPHFAGGEGGPAAPLAILLDPPRFLGILPMYLLFLVGAPLAAGRLRAGRTASVLAASAAIYLAAQFVPRTFGSLPVYGAFNLAAWQLLFFWGMAAGACRDRFAPLLDSRASTVVLLAAAALFAARHGLLPLPPKAPPEWKFLLSKRDLGPLRVVNFAAIAFLAACAIRRAGRWAEVGWLALPGRWPLTVFSTHVLLIYLFAPVLDKCAGAPAAGRYFLVLSLACCSCLPALAAERLGAGKFRPPAAGAPGRIAEGD